MTALVAVGVIIAIVAIVTVAFFYSKQENTRMQKKLLKNQKYTQAVTEFKDLGGFRKEQGVLGRSILQHWFTGT